MKEYAKVFESIQNKYFMKPVNEAFDETTNDIFRSLRLLYFIMDETGLTYEHREARETLRDIVENELADVDNIPADQLVRSCAKAIAAMYVIAKSRILYDPNLDKVVV
jgi:hypothetical protein